MYLPNVLTNTIKTHIDLTTSTCYNYNIVDKLVINAFIKEVLQ